MYQLAKKKTTHPTCPISGQRLNGLPAVRPSTLHRVNKSKKTVHRAYGGHLAAGVVKDRIVRAFLVEEQKIVKKVRAGQHRERCWRGWRGCTHHVRAIRGWEEAPSCWRMERMWKRRGGDSVCACGRNFAGQWDEQIRESWAFVRLCWAVLCAAQASAGQGAAPLGLGHSKGQKGSRVQWRHS